MPGSADPFRIRAICPHRCTGPEKAGTYLPSAAGFCSAKFKTGRPVRGNTRCASSENGAAFPPRRSRPGSRIPPVCSADRKYTHARSRETFRRPSGSGSGLTDIPGFPDCGASRGICRAKQVASSATIFRIFINLNTSDTAVCDKLSLSPLSEIPLFDREKRSWPAEPPDAENTSRQTARIPWEGRQTPDQPILRGHPRRHYPVSNGDPANRHPAVFTENNTKSGKEFEP